MAINMTEDEMQHVAEILESHMHERIAARKAARNAHWKRRVCLVIVVLITGYGVHKAIELPALAAAAQSCELILASLIDSIFSKVREME